MRNPALLVGLVAVVITAGGCTRIRQNQGYLVDETLVTSIQPGVDNRESVSKTLGRPTFAGQFDSKEWYYVTRITGQYAFAQPKVLSQSILVVSFDGAGNVAKVERRGLEQVARINPSKDRTETLGRDTGLLQELFGNIGQVGAGSGPLGQSGNTGRDGPR
ncbi:outer membrane protein assembly factor BamE [Polymorphobacter fuscus]|uniref:Outer membrane protein assembly factor BamE n=1 Tax=Sandarakinorhabdus fusca TaxID=1439888 RepID=A0A7C9KWA0_9SPHN|nr:outer membrane protein assembly factor BamE [Polymorphobacter fuscus]KAB7647560.1 outer membrane protein assembly factor BamE [Polymorphobacter fuscus]MQT16825.1 outer membrane protein assembly factor BamE [Polymorphobacter fuscus]NJC09187.1 outer membrane protein assembly factor BamE (lipoprotein component of BamABCDE complex) [Polymorphobacter fuscus]